MRMLHVVCGAPCAGKTTYVEQNAKDGDLIIDADKIANAFGGERHQAKGDPFEVALKARKMAIDHALKNKCDTWLIDTLPSAEKLDLYKQEKAEIVFLDTSKDKCLERAKERPNGTVEAIEKFYNNTEALQNLKHSLGGKQMEHNENNNGQERTFTQAEVDEMVKTRLGRERSKFADYDDLKAKAAKYDEIEEQSKSMLQRETERADDLQKQLDDMKKAQTVRELRTRVAESTGVPYSLLTADTEEGCEEQAKAIMAFAKPDGYPKVKDGGEVHHSPGKKTTREQFAEFMKENF